MDKPSQTSALCLKLEPPGPLLSEAMDLWEKDGEVAIETLADLPSEAELSARAHPYLVIATVNTAENATHLAKFYGTLKSEIERKRTVLLIFTTIQNPKFQLLLRKLGQVEIVRNTSKAKSLKLKLVAAQKLLSNLNHHVEALKEKVTELPEIPCADDCWLLLKAGDLKRVRNLWVIELLGPSPGKGKWVKSGDGGELDSTWVWTPTPDGESFLPNGGHWSFFGKRPEFHRQKWSLVSPKPLFKYASKDGTRSFTRMQGNSRELSLEITKNSVDAVRKLPQIKESLLSEVRNQVGNRSGPDDGVQVLSSAQRQISEDLYIFEGSPGAPRGGLELFKRLMDPAEIRAHFLEGAKEAARVTVWTSHQSEKYDFTLYLPESMDEGFFLKHRNFDMIANFARMRTGTSEKLFFHLATRKGTIFFTQKVGDMDSGSGAEIRSKIPSEVFELGNADRVRRQPKEKAYLALSKDLMFEVRDVSCADVSVYVTSDLFDRITQGDRFAPGALKANGRSFEVDLRFSWKQKINDSDWVLGFKFDALPEEVKKAIIDLGDLVFPGAA